MRLRAAYTSGSDIVPGTDTTLNGKPVGEALGLVKTCAASSNTWRSTDFFSAGAIPDSSHNAKAVPTWTPAAPAARMFFSCRGFPKPPANQKGSPNCFIFSGSTTSLSP